jgi:cell division septation protein DedD
LADFGLAKVGSDVELRNQLDFQRQRCRSLGAMQAEAARAASEDSATRARADSAARANKPPGRRAAETPSRRGFFVQISAVATQSAANIEVTRVRRAGYTPVTVREGGLFKIRIGPYPTRADASTAMTQARGKLGGKPFVVQVQ